MNCRSYLDSFEPVLYATVDPDAPPRVPISASAPVRKKLARMGRAAAALETPDGVAFTSKAIRIQLTVSPLEFALTRSELNAESGSIHVYSDSGEEVRVTGMQAEVLGRRISGYDVITKWLREYTCPYLRRKFNQEALDDLISLVSRISAQAELLERADKLVAQMIDSGDVIAPPVS